MTSPVALAATHHDPEQRLTEQIARLLPRLQTMYSHITVLQTPTTPRDPSLRQTEHVVLDVLEDVFPTGLPHLGRYRRRVLATTLRNVAQSQASHLHLCDFDRVLHWAEYYPDELRATLRTMSGYDFTVLGRTERAFASHPRVQRDTETLINHVFALASGHAWDVTAGSRGISRRAAERLIAGSNDDTVGVDCSWPLFIQQQGVFTLHALETEGLEFETPDRFEAEIAAAGGREAWIARIDADPRQWAVRAEVAMLEIQAAAGLGAD